MLLYPYTLLAIGLLLITVLVRWRRSRRFLAANPHRLPLPPGPPSLPLIGNLLDLPRDKPWLAYDAMAKKYGDIIYLDLFAHPIVVLGSAQAAADLFEKRSAHYSDRLHLTMLKELMGFDWTISLMSYGDMWRRHRKRFYQHFGPHAAESYKPIQFDQSCTLLRRLKSTPEQFLQHIRHTTSATIMKITYGFDVKEEHDEYVDLAEAALKGYAMGGNYGRFWVDIFPILKYIPAWAPGANFHKLAAHYRQLAVAMCVQPFEAVKVAMGAGTASHSAAAAMIEDLPIGPGREEEEMISRNSAGIAYGAGADTTMSALHSFILAMVLHPEVQKKAQAELDAVVGPNRLPTFDDRASLPYIEAVVKETLRWQLVTPLAAPHLLVENDEYRGYHIPKGAVVIGNAWSILHNPVEYPNPEAFIPDRFLKDGKINPDVRDPTTAAFGFGRRICPGMVMSVNTLYSIISCVLHTFNISHAIDVNGDPIPVKVDVSTGLLSYPAPFQCDIKPRSATAEALIIN